MRTEVTIEIDAPAADVWDVYVDVERWPEWTPSVTRIVALDGPGIEVGNRFEIRQPRFPRLVWVVTEVEPGVSWVWRQRSPGGTTDASHQLVVLDPGRTLVRQRIDQRGPVGATVGRLMARTTRRYLALESNGLQARVEQQRRDGSPT